MLVGKLVSQLLTLISTVFVIRKLPVEEYGTFSFIINSLGLLAVFGCNPISSMVSRYLPELIQKNQVALAHKLVRIGSLLLVLSIMATGLIVMCFQNIFATFLNIHDLPAFIGLFLIFLVIKSSCSYLQSVLSAFLLQKKIAFANIVQSFLPPALYLSFLSILNIRVMLIIGIVVASLVLVFYLLTISRYLAANGSERNQDSLSFEWRRARRFGILSLFNEIGSGLVGRTSDYFIISSLSNPIQVAMYAFAQKIYDIIYKLCPIKELQGVIGPILIQKFSDNDDLKSYNTLFNLFVKLLMPLFLFSAIYFVFFGEDIIKFAFGVKYQDAFIVSCIVLFSGCIVAFFYPVGLTIILKERMEIALYSKLVGIISLPGGIWAMKAYGIVGVAFMTLLGDFLRNYLMYIMLRRHISVRYELSNLCNYLILGILSCGLGLILSNMVIDIWTATLASLFWFLICLVLFLVIHPFNAADLAILNELSKTSRIALKIGQIIRLFHSFLPTFRLTPH